MGRLRIFCSPYGFVETVNWIIKHFIIDIFYPFVVLFLLFIMYTIIPLEVLLALGIFLGVSVVAFIVRWVRRICNQIINVGSLNEDGWREFTVNDLQKVSHKIGFVGDIMKMGKYQLIFEKRVKKFFSGVHLMVGNLEGILTDSNWLGITAQKHEDSILRHLRRLGHHSRDWLLSTTNNHSSDFGDKEFQNSNLKIGSKGYNVFGYHEKNQDHQNFLFRNEINIVSGTMWNNQREHKLVSQFEDIGKYYKENMFNILFPHWHYENESYVRKRNKAKSIALIFMGYYLVLERIKRKVYNKIKALKVYKSLTEFLKYRNIKRYFSFVDPLVNLKDYRIFNKKFELKIEDSDVKDWDLIFGHHSHVPQPITKYHSKILAFSGGNFTSSQKRKKHISGLIMKCEIGPAENSGQMEIGKVEWSYTINEKEKIKKKRGNKLDGKIKVNSVVIDCKRNRNNSFTNLRNRIWINITYIIFFSVFEFILFGSIYNIFDIFRDYSIILFGIAAVTFVILTCYYFFKSNRR